MSCRPASIVERGRPRARPRLTMDHHVRERFVRANDERSPCAARRGAVGLRARSLPRGRYASARPALDYAPSSPGSAADRDGLRSLATVLSFDSLYERDAAGSEGSSRARTRLSPVERGLARAAGGLTIIVLGKACNAAGNFRSDPLDSSSSRSLVAVESEAKARADVQAKATAEAEARAEDDAEARARQEKNRRTERCEDERTGCRERAEHDGSRLARHTCDTAYVACLL